MADRDPKSPLPGVHVAPTEPVALRKLGRVSMVTEKHGVDVMWIVDGKKWGVQRKEWKDLITSVEDGRWAREVAMMTGKLDVAWVMVEGWPRISGDGMVIGKAFGRAWSEASMWKVLWGAGVKGISVHRTVNLSDTIESVERLVEWSRKGKHSSIATRPGPVGMWGHKTDRDWALHLLQGMDGVGVELAGRIFDKFGKVPLRWEVDVKQLMEVEGIGKVKAAKLIRALEGGEEGGDDG